MDRPIAAQPVTPVLHILGKVAAIATLATALGLGQSQPALAQTVDLSAQMRASEFRLAGLHKLSQAELNYLERWLSTSATLRQRSSTSYSRPTLPPVSPRTTLGGGSCASPIESKISGEFSGWDGDTTFQLTNGQIWKQTSYAYKYAYKYRPDVIIYQGTGGCKLQVEGVSGQINVRRIR